MDEMTIEQLMSEYQKVLKLLVDKTLFFERQQFALQQAKAEMHDAERQAQNMHNIICGRVMELEQKFYPPSVHL